MDVDLDRLEALFVAQQIRPAEDDLAVAPRRFDGRTLIGVQPGAAAHLHDVAVEHPLGQVEQEVHERGQIALQAVALFGRQERRTRQQRAVPRVLQMGVAAPPLAQQAQRLTAPVGISQEGGGEAIGE